MMVCGDRYVLKYSKKMDSHGKLGMGNGVYKPYHRFDGLVTLAQTMHDLIYLSTFILSKG